MHEIYNLFNDHVINNKTSNKTLKNEWEKNYNVIITFNSTFGS